jgi:hypothetical protein
MNAYSMFIQNVAMEGERPDTKHRGRPPKYLTEEEKTQAKRDMAKTFF